jgi:hypothetical protein
VLDRLRDLGGDREQEVDLPGGELAGLPRAHVQRAGEPLAREDRHRQDRFVLVLGEIRKRLEARVEMRLRRDHHRLPGGRRRARDSLSGPHPRPARHLLDTGAVRRAQDELVRLLVVEVDKAGIGAERIRDLRRDEREHLLEIERRVDGGDRLREQAQVAGGLIHATRL